MKGHTKSLASQTWLCVVASSTTALIGVPSAVMPVSTTSVCSRSLRPSHRIANALQAIGLMRAAYSGGLNIEPSFHWAPRPVFSSSRYFSLLHVDYPTAMRARGGTTPPCFESVRPTLPPPSRTTGAPPFARGLSELPTTAPPPSPAEGVPAAAEPRPGC